MKMVHPRHPSMRSKGHPGFKAEAASIEKREGVSEQSAGAILASATRNASASARRANPRLIRVRGGGQ